MEATPERVAPEPPRYRGTGLFIASGILGAVGLGARIESTAMEIYWLNEPSCTEDCIEEWSGPFMPHPIAGPFTVTSIGLLGGGMAMAGRWRAHADLFHNTPVEPSRKMPLAETLGWGLFGGGVALWIGTRFLERACDTDACRLAVLEPTHYVSTGVLIAGTVLGSYATGYRRYFNRHRGLELQFTPSASRQRVGLTVSGRF
ncbi:MAG: hypothetical protein AAF799_34175 [Myxococcota bacterium]